MDMTGWTPPESWGIVNGALAQLGVDKCERQSAVIETSSEPVIILYDITSGLPQQAWSPNIWKARLVLNYKRIPYKTVWLSLPDIETTVKGLGCSYTRMQSGKPLYTLPVIVDNSGETPVAVGDSFKIAKYLDAKFPDRPVFPKKGIALEHAFETYFMTLIRQSYVPVLIPLIWTILDERGKAYFRETRERWFGKSIEELSAEMRSNWGTVKEACDKLADILDKNGPGVDFVAGGSEPTWADFNLISYLALLKEITPEEGWNDIMNWNGGRWQRLWDRSEEWRAVH